MALTMKDAIAQDTRFGLKGGITFYKGSIDFAGFEESTSSALGFTAGIYAEFQLSDYLSIQPEILYNQKNTKDDDGFFDDNSQTNFTYLDVPVLLRLNVPLEGKVSPFVTAGPYIGYLLDASDEFNGETEDISEFIENLNYGFMIGGGVQYGNFHVEVRYDIGLANIFKDELFMDEFNDVDDFDDFFDFGDFFGGSSIEGKLSGLSLTVGVSF